MLDYVLQFKRKPPTLVHSTLTSLINRWRPETHSFHLPCGEMTTTLLDWGMIKTLPLEGRALTGRVERKNWHDRVITLIGDCPPLPPPRAPKGNRTSGVPLPWLLKHRSKFLEGAEPPGGGAVRQGLPVVSSHIGRVSRLLWGQCPMDVSRLPKGLGCRVQLGVRRPRISIPFEDGRHVRYVWMCLGPLLWM